MLAGHALRSATLEDRPEGGRLQPQETGSKGSALLVSHHWDLSVAATELSHRRATLRKNQQLVAEVGGALEDGLRTGAPPLAGEDELNMLLVRPFTGCC